MFRFSRVTKNDALSKASVQEAAAIYQKTKDGNSNMDFLNSLIGSNGKVDVSAAAKVAASLKSGATGKEQVLGFSDLAAEITTGQEKAEVARLSKTFDDINSQLDFMLGQEPFKPIDWKKWESELPGLENIVAEFKNASQSLELPSFADDFSSEAETGFANLVSCPQCLQTAFQSTLFFPSQK
eukprot:TRINITY_DN3479_c0_g1_i3.p1 TRINITY_DN3479_c0_g1~~TRINITY_DN3479_c0_g1_i3.p1  ORF type:complete len:190 (-),score=62.67 TRINITY_DN3479_c0_g1_i3:419-967(-)